MCFQMLSKFSKLVICLIVTRKLFHTRGGTCAWNSECPLGRWTEMTTTMLRDDLNAVGYTALHTDMVNAMSFWVAGCFPDHRGACSIPVSSLIVRWSGGPDSFRRLRLTMSHTDALRHLLPRLHADVIAVRFSGRFSVFLFAVVSLVPSQWHPPLRPSPLEHFGPDCGRWRSRQAVAGEQLSTTAVVNAHVGGKTCS